MGDENELLFDEDDEDENELAIDEGVESDGTPDEEDTIA